MKYNLQKYQIQVTSLIYYKIQLFFFSTMEIQNRGDVTILCPMCGIQFLPTIGNICQACTMAKTDITIGITKQAIVNYCRFCQRYMRPPWIACERDSKELLALLLKKIKGLNKAKIINAGFIWTQPHSKRIKVKITIEKQLNNNTKIQQTFVVEFTELYMQCDDCKKEFTPHTWGAVVQVRQHVDHKKTFYLIEQLILKHGAYDKVLKISNEDDGINFYYKNTTHAQRLVDFLNSILPTSVKHSKQLISHDMNSNTFVYKYGFAVQLPKICRNDLVIIPKKLAKQLGGCSQLLLCLKVGQTMGLVDLNNFNYVTMNSIQYYYYEKQMEMLPLSRYKKEFEILDCNPVDKKKHHANKSISNKLVPKLYHYNVTRRDQWENIQIRGTLGDMKCGTIVEGFDLRFLNHTAQLGDLNGYQQIVIVKRAKVKTPARIIKLKKLEDEGVIIEQKQNTKKKIKKNKEDKQDQDYEDFVDEIQTDPTLRKGLKVYKNQDALKHMTKEQLDQVMQQMQICDLMQDMKIGEQELQLVNTFQNDAQIDDLIAKMQKVTIEKNDENDPQQQEED